MMATVLILFVCVCEWGENVRVGPFRLRDE